MLQVSIDRLREVLSYNPETGALTWCVSPHPRIKVGQEAGAKNSRGYILVKVDGIQMRAHRVIFAIQMGRWPIGLVDHRDTNESNNRWSNLREATDSQNCANSKIQSNNKVGLKGVHKHRDGFRAMINFRGRKIHIGKYLTAGEAHAAYAEKAKELFGEFARAA